MAVPLPGDILIAGQLTDIVRRKYVLISIGKKILPPSKTTLFKTDVQGKLKSTI